MRSLKFYPHYLRLNPKYIRQGSEWSAEDWLGLARPGQNESSLMVEIRLTGQS